MAALSGVCPMKQPSWNDAACGLCVGLVALCLPILVIYAITRPDPNLERPIPGMSDPPRVPEPVAWVRLEALRQPDSPYLGKRVQLDGQVWLVGNTADNG